MSQDAQYLEHWLISEWGDIIKLVDKFRQESGWNTDRNIAHDWFKR